MKKKLFLIFALAGAIFASCSKELEQPDVVSQADGEGLLCIRVKSGADVLTKAGSDTTSVDYERALNKVKVLIFNGDGNLVKALDCASPYTAASHKVKYGTYSVYAVANGDTLNLSSIATKSALDDKVFALAANSTTASTGMLMEGSSSVTVDKESVDVTVNMSRYVGRVNLISVKNNLPNNQAMTIDYAMLINVVNNQNIAGNAQISDWGNPKGRKKGTDNIIAAASDANDAALTFKTVGKNVANGATSTSDVASKFYSYANSSAEPTPVRCVVKATWGDKSYYYPVTIANFAANTTYDITLTISGEGSNDPNVPVKKGNISATITVNKWVGGTAYDEEI